MGGMVNGKHSTLLFRTTRRSSVFKASAATRTLVKPEGSNQVVLFGMVPPVIPHRAVREYQIATEAVEAAGASAAAMDKAMSGFERATATMDAVGGWDAETFAMQVSDSTLTRTMLDS